MSFQIWETVQFGHFGDTQGYLPFAQWAKGAFFHFPREQVIVGANLINAQVVIQSGDWISGPFLACALYRLSSSSRARHLCDGDVESSNSVTIPVCDFGHVGNGDMLVHIECIDI